VLYISRVLLHPIHLHFGLSSPRNKYHRWLAIVLDTWAQRNCDLHGRDQQSRQPAGTAQLSQRANIGAERTGQTCAPLHVRRSIKTYYMRALINSWKSVLEASHKERLVTHSLASHSGNLLQLHLQTHLNLLYRSAGQCQSSENAAR
jgi:hypothetical protein